MVQRFNLACTVLLAALLAAAGSISGASAEVRLSLVIGNGKYQRTTSLDNPVSDARLIAATLKGQGFDVALFTDLDLKAMKRAFQAFYAKVQAAGKDTIALVYYAGHGIQLKGANYLIPIDAEIERESDVDVETVRADSIMEMIAFAGSPFNIVILDACRNNPFRGFRSASRGLAQIEAPTGTLIAFSTAPGKTAADGPRGGNSPYSAALAKTIIQPGLSIEDVFKRVRRTVSAETKGEQVPWESSSVIGDFYPVAAANAIVVKPAAPPEHKSSSWWPWSSATPAPLPAPAPALPRADPAPPANPTATITAPQVSLVDLTRPNISAAPPEKGRYDRHDIWERIKTTNSVALLAAFVKEYGDTDVGKQAQARLEELKARRVSATPVPGRAVSLALPSSDSSLVSPARGVGSIHIGMSENEVVSILQKPEKRSFSTDGTRGWDVLHYRGDSLQVRLSNGKVNKIYAYSGRIFPDGRESHGSFKAHLQNGVSMASSLNDVIAIMGEPRSASYVTVLNPQWWIGYPGIWFHFNKDSQMLYLEVF